MKRKHRRYRGVSYRLETIGIIVRMIVWLIVIAGMIILLLEILSTCTIFMGR